jgi:glutamyl-tRNA synthetase
MRVRFAPSPTGALHIGGIRTALFNYLLAKQQNGTFILRIEDTDQVRYVPGAEAYIEEALAWCGLTPDESPSLGGPHAPYRQSERKGMYLQYAEQLVANGHAYYAFDTPEQLAETRQQFENQGKTFIYNASSRLALANSLALSNEKTQELLASGAPYTIRLKMPEGETITFTDAIRGEVSFATDGLDDKVLLKGDGMPTYHLANIVDDHLMEITHVIRGEEWLPSTGHHVLMYRCFGWQPPQFAHLPLILKPDGKGKLSKRDGKKLGIPVFPLSWEGETEEDSFEGFRELGFEPEAVINFLALLGWNDGTDKEIFNMDELVAAFDLGRIHKAGARFDYQRAKWFNQQHIQHSSNEQLAERIAPLFEAKNYAASHETLLEIAALYKERVTFLNDFVEETAYVFEGIKSYDEKTIQKKWKPENFDKFLNINKIIKDCTPFESAVLEHSLHGHMQETGLKMGEVMPALRIALTGTMQGPSVYAIMALLGKRETTKRLETAFAAFNQLVA